jgi:hypothetical protein
MKNFIRKYWVLIILGLIVVILIVFNPWIAQNWGRYKFYNLFFIFVTGGVIFWYTKETQKLREETQKQTELQLRPYVVLDIMTNADYGSEIFVLSNIGKGIALNIEIIEPNLVFSKPDKGVREIKSMPAALGEDKKAYVLEGGSWLRNEDIVKFEIVVKYRNQIKQEFKTKTCFNCIRGNQTPFFIYEDL